MNSGARRTTDKVLIANAAVKLTAVTEAPPSAPFASSHTRNLWDHRAALVDEVIKPAAMSTLLMGSVGDIAAWWLPAAPIMVVGFACSTAVGWTLWREFLAKLPEVRP
jgi:hypothetical protein